MARDSRLRTPRACARLEIVSGCQAKRAGPTGGPLNGGHWNDADMLQVGDIGLSITEQTSHFALWNLMASPLLVGSDVSMLTPASLKILGNAEVTAVNQDPLGVQGVPIAAQLADPTSASCWSKPMADGSVVGHAHAPPPRSLRNRCARRAAAR